MTLKNKINNKINTILADKGRGGLVAYSKEQIAVVSALNWVLDELLEEEHPCSKIDFKSELEGLQNDLVFIFQDLCDNNSEFRAQGECNLNGLVDRIQILSFLKRGIPISEIVTDSPHGGALIERLEKQ